MQDEETALILASRNGHELVVKALLEAGADKEAKNKVRESLEYAFASCSNAVLRRVGVNLS